MNTHGIPAQPQQLAAGKELKEIILPLEKYAKTPLPYLDLCGSGKAAKDGDGNWRLWFPGKDEQLELDRFTLKAYPKGCNDGIVIPFKEGDRIYLQEEWCDLREYFSRKDAFTLKSELKENCHNQAGVDALEMASLWQPAHTMPPEAAQHWYTVTEVRVVQMDEIDSELCHKAGLSDVALAPDTDIDTVGRVWAGIFMCWNKGNSEHFWQDDRWVVVLSVEAIAG
jgi:hypothetical protein